MKFSMRTSLSLLLFTFFLFHPIVEAQTKRLKRPSSRVGINSVDTFVRESFDLYDKVYRFDGYAQVGKSLSDDDLELLIDAVEDGERVLSTAPNAVADIDGAGILKQGKATLQMNRAKKALKYSVKTAKKLITEKKAQKDETDEEVGSNDDTPSSDDTTGSSTSGGGTNGNTSNKSDSPKDVKVYSKFDFVPGDKLLFYDDFSADFVGDFPSKWNTNGSGEVVTIGSSPEKWFEIKPGSNIFYIPDVPNLPEEYTIEFDLLALGIDNKTSSSTNFRIILTDGEQFKWGNNYVYASLPLCQYHPVGMRVRSTKMGINNNITADIRKAVLNRPHVSIAVNKQRFRLWVNEKKYIDIPRFLPEGALTNKLRFEIPYMKDGKDRLFMTNLKVAEGGVDLRRQLINEGKFSTNGILFDSGSANIQPQSFGIIRQVSQALQQVPNMRLNIIGHTDADGSDDANMTLSKKRAEAVKNALVSIYNISDERLQTDGKGESEPVGDNNTADGKAQNRRVVFVKI